MPDSKRAFMMGNALVVGMVRQVAEVLISDISAPSVSVERTAS